MNKKRILSIIICITICITVIFVVIFSILSNRKFSQIITPNRDKFEYNQEKYGSDLFMEPVGEGLYCIDYARYEPALFIKHQDQYNDVDIILEALYERCFENEILYYYSPDGFAIAYPESNICKVFIVSPPAEIAETILSNRHKEDDYRIMKISADDYPENKLVVYLNSFDEYTPYEQKMLNKLVEKHQKSEKFADGINRVIDFFGGLD